MIPFVRRVVEKLEKITGLPLKHLIKFGIVGSSGVLVNIGFFTLLKDVIGVLEEIASPIAIEISIISNFFLNSFWTWRDRKAQSRKEHKIRFLKYNSITGITSGLLNYGIFLLMSKVFHWNPYLSQLTGIFFGMSLNFVINHKWTFKEK